MCMHPFLYVFICVHYGMPCFLIVLSLLVSFDVLVVLYHVI